MYRVIVTVITEEANIPLKFTFEYPNQNKAITAAKAFASNRQRNFPKDQLLFQLQEKVGWVDMLMTENVINRLV